MERIKVLQENKFLKFTPTQVQDIRKEYGFHNDREMNEAVDKLREWVQKQNHFVYKDFDTDYLETVILRAKGSMEKAKKRLDKLCTLKTLVPEVFHDLQVKTEFYELNKFIQSYSVPIPTADNYRLVILRFTDQVPSKFTLATLARFANVCSEYVIRKDYVHGFEGIVDLTGLSITTLIPLFNPLLLQKFNSIISEGYGVRIKSIRLISASKIIDTFVSILKQGMGEKVGNRINVYKNYEALAEDVPKKLLPKEFGGTGGTIDEIQAGWLADICSDEHQSYIDEVMTWKTDESKRLTENFNQEYLGIPGSFRALVVD